MTRHFLTLYLSIVVVLAAVSWGQERLWQSYGADAKASEMPQAGVLTLLAWQLQGVPGDRRTAFVDDIARDTGLDLELLDPQDVAGASLATGRPTIMDGADGRVWILQRLQQDDRVLAFRFSDKPQRRLPDWVLAFVFYAAIALVVMVWLWPMTRDLRALERTTVRFGDRNWSFDAAIGPRSPVHPLAQAFRRMASRIDGLIGSHKDMSNALSHEIKTPLARMRFEIELARMAADRDAVVRHLDNLNTDITELNAFVTATLEYAVLERAEMALNIAPHDFTAIVPAVIESVTRGSRTELIVDCDVDGNATAVVCDIHLLETVLRNLLYNAIRHASRCVRVSFAMVAPQRYKLCVEDDGPGIAEQDRERVFGSFVQLGLPTGEKTGFGLGLAIVKRIAEWHGGTAHVERSALGGACFAVDWRAPEPRHR
jgi:two-component system, OmpR family, sensor kinase